MAETNVRYQASYVRDLKAEVGRILETAYKVDVNAREKILATYFGEAQLPHWYFYSNTAEEIARHLFIVTRLLTANAGQVHHVSDDSRVITYLINVGRDFPGRLERVIEQNASMRIASYDSESTLNGLRIVSLEKLAREPEAFEGGAADAVRKLKDDLLYYGDSRDSVHAERFVESLSPRYLAEELQSTFVPRRAERHLVVYERVWGSDRPHAEVSEVRYEDDTGRTEKEVRVMIGVMEPGARFIPEVLRLFEKRGINLRRSYFDLFRHDEGNVGILSAYFAPGYALEGLEAEIEGLAGVRAEKKVAAEELEERIESILRRLPSKADPAAAAAAIGELKALCAENGKVGGGPESGSFYLNCVTDFLAAAELSGVDESPAALRLLLGYDAFDEFFVTAQANGVSANVPGYRIKHSSARGPAKGGLRIDPIVSFDEVAALSFMMTWKCARSRILFGGGKGGLMLNPRTFEGSAIDYFDTLTSFGRSLFLVSGPLRDVPAGDVGCGPREIGFMFEGFKSALRDLAMMAYGLKPGVSLVGSRIVSIEDARRMLAEHFAVDWTDPEILRELCGNEKYLELVAAAHITGKPKLGIAARGPATGLGMAYAVLAAVGNLYLRGEWKASRALTAEEEALLRKACALDEAAILREESPEAWTADPSAGSSLGGRLLRDGEWKVLSTKVYPVLLEGKTLSVQGSGKVGGALISSLAPYGVKLVAVSDAGGAVFGDGLDAAEVLAAVEKSREHPDKALRASAIHVEKNVSKKLPGAANAASVLEVECDILAPSALENAVTEANAARIRAKIEVCGANGPNSSRAERILSERGVTVLYDFLANGAGVTASYFEWLRNLADRFRYEAESVKRVPFDLSCMDPYVMPEFRDRIRAVLATPEGPEATAGWNALLRDIMFAAVNEDMRFSRESGASMKAAGFVNAQLRVLAAYLSRMGEKERSAFESALPEKTRLMLEPFLAHPEARLLRGAARP